MRGDIDLEDAKKRVAGKLMDIEGVSGVGIGPDRIRVYLARDDDRVRTAVAHIMRANASEAPFECINTGHFFAQ